MILDIIDKMKKVIVFFLCVFSVVCAYSQTGADSDCTSDMENIFKVHDLKIKYETVQHIYGKHGFLYIMSKDRWNSYFKLIRGYPLFEEQQDSVSGVKHKKIIGFEEAVRLQKDGIKPEDLVLVKPISEEEMNGYIEQLNCTPKEALTEYLDFVRDIKLEKEIYLKCIDVELAKGDLSEYAKDKMHYNFSEPGMSIISTPWNFTKLDFLKIFKEFILNDNEDVLPEGVRVHVYLKCNCKIP